MLINLGKNSGTLQSTYKNAVINSIPPNGGLWFPMILMQPESINVFGSANYYSLHKNELSLKILSYFLKDEICSVTLSDAISSAFNFEIPLIRFDSFNIYELTHGPTQAFKDFGARFNAIITKCLNNNPGTLIAATSGDTGGAVISACNNASIPTLVFYPHDKCSVFQRQQMTNKCFQHNIPIAIEGCFDDCQSIAKKLLADNKIKTCSGNSINILRLLAQVTYYFTLAQEYVSEGAIKKFSVVVPTGNLGNVVAAVIAKRLGAPIENIIIAVNSNSVLNKEIIKGNQHLPIQQAIKTYSTAMDVCIPNNLLRLQYLCKDIADLNDWLFIKQIDEIETKQTILNCHDELNYVVDPHTAVGIAAAKYFNHLEHLTVLSTAAPQKFADVLQSMNIKIDLPPPLPPNDELIIRCKKDILDKLYTRSTIVLIGMAAAGKTTHARTLSKALSLPWIDIDDYIINENKMSLQEIISIKGQDIFNKIEEEACLINMDKENYILSPGGSCNNIESVNRKLKEKCITIWLDPPISTIEERIGDLDKRGVVRKYPNQTVNDIYLDRKPKYESNYDIRIRSDSCIIPLINLLKLFAKV
jgi:threonine synthase